MYFLNFTIKDGQEIDRIFIHSLTSQKVDRLTGSRAGVYTGLRVDVKAGRRVDRSTCRQLMG